jgi:hypothetical protein
VGGFVRSGYPGSDLKASHSLTHHTHSMDHSYEAVSAAGASELRGSRWSGERWSEAAPPSCIAAIFDFGRRGWNCILTQSSHGTRVSAAGASELRGSRWSGERWSEAALPSCIAATTSDIVRQFSMPSVGTFGHPTETQQAEQWILPSIYPLQGAAGRKQP